MVLTGTADLNFILMTLAYYLLKSLVRAELTKCSRETPYQSTDVTSCLTQRRKWCTNEVNKELCVYFVIDNRDSQAVSSDLTHIRRLAYERQSEIDMTEILRIRRAVAPG